MKRATTLCALLLAACAETPPLQAQAPAPPRYIPPAQTQGPVRVGKDGVLGATARRLEAEFGPPSSMVVEGAGRRIQFAGPSCVLDAYLYPPEGGGDPVVTYVDTRRPTGEDIDHALCVAALRSRR